MQFSAWYQAYRAFRPFSDAEAWLLFKIAAIAEAIGWTLLIIGVLCERLPGLWGTMPVQLAGRTHGMLFLTYIVAALVLAPSLGWSLRRTVLAGLASVPPYGSLVYEVWTAHGRSTKSYRQLRLCIRFAVLAARPEPAPPSL